MRSLMLREAWKEEISHTIDLISTYDSD